MDFLLSLWHTKEIEDSFQAECAAGLSFYLLSRSELNIAKHTTHLKWAQGSDYLEQD